MNTDTNYCSWDLDSTFLIFSNNVFGDFIYYSHLLPVVAVIIFITLLLWQNHKNPAVQSLFVAGSAFTLWSLSDLVLWATASPSITMFFWSIIIHFEILVYIGSAYFLHHYLLNRGPRLRYEVAILLAYIPIAFFAHTSLNLVAYDYTNCWREAVEGPLLLYVYAFEIVLSLWILFIGLKHAFSPKIIHKSRKEILLATLGTTLFLISFSFGNIIGTLEVDWELGQYGLFAAPLFIGLLTYLLTQFKTINVKLLGTEALVTSMTVLIASILFVRTIQNVRIITSITILLIVILGYILIRSVKKEVKQREQIEHLAKKLEKANTRLKQLDKLKSEFVSIASHQLRSPITAIAGYTSLLREGSYGEVSAKMKEPLERIEKSARMMATSIEDYLNVSRIESGNMKYNYTDFNIVDEVEHISDDLRTEALKQNLILLFRKKVDGSGIIKADIGKTQQIIHNLINNSIKYTQKGSITVYVHDDVKAKKVFIDIIDTGVGMSEATQHTIFQKFERGDSANKVNVKGTGLGLYVALKMAEVMGGDITAHSEGEEKGSRFTIELPLAI